MPTYDYKCKTCGKEFEYFQKITDEPLSHCPNEICTCQEKGKGEVFRKISKNIGLVFNGSGFYLTDYAKKHSSRPNTNGNGNTTKPSEVSAGTNGTKKASVTEK